MLYRMMEAFAPRHRYGEAGYHDATLSISQIICYEAEEGQHRIS